MNINDLMKELRSQKNLDKRRRAKSRELGIEIIQYEFLVKHTLTKAFKDRNLDIYPTFESFKESFLNGSLVVEDVKSQEKKDKRRSVSLTYCESKELVNKLNEDLSLRHIVIPIEMSHNIEVISFDSETWLELTQENFSFDFNINDEEIDEEEPVRVEEQPSTITIEEPQPIVNKEKDLVIVNEPKTNQNKESGGYQNPYLAAKASVFQLFNGHKEAITQPNLIEKPEELRDNLLKLITDEEMKPIEAKFALQFGNYKAKPFKEWVNNVLELFQRTSFGSGSFDEKLLLECVNEVTQEISNKPLERLSLEESYRLIDKSANSGFPFFRSSWSHDENIVKYFMKEASEILSGKNDMMKSPSILYKRVQPKGDDVKMRPIECPSKSEALAAKCFTFPLTERFKEMEQFCGFNGGENVWRYISDHYDYQNWISSDYSKFDATAADMMPFAFMVLKNLYPEHSVVLDNFLHYYSYGSLITPIGMLKTKLHRHGLFSGGGFTSVIGTLVNAISHKYTLKKMNVRGKVLSFGDDVVIFTNDKFNPQDYSKYMSELGLICNPDKQEITSGEKRYFSFLGMYYHNGKRLRLIENGMSLEMLPTFPIMRLASGLCYREYMISSKNIEARVKDLEFYGADPDQINEYRKSMVKIEEAVGIFMKLNVARNHEDFISVFNYIRGCFSHKLNSDLIAPFESLAPMLRSHRTTRNFGLKKTAGMRLLWMLEGKDPTKLYQGYNIDEAELQPYYTEEKIFKLLKESVATTEEID